MEKAPIDLESLEVYLHPSKMTQEEWTPLYQKMKAYIEEMDDRSVIHGSYSTAIEKHISNHHIHINVRRAFTTDAVLLYKNLSSYINQTNPLILLGVKNRKGRLSSPFIMDLLVLLNAHLPHTTTINGYLHPYCWNRAIHRVRMHGYLQY